MAGMQQLALLLTLSLGIVLAIGTPASAADVVPPTADTAVTPAGLLAAADAAVGAGNLELARSLFLRLAGQFAATPEAAESRRALSIIAVSASRAGANLSGPPVPDENGDVVVRDEPYSLKTSERLRLTVWEKVDFGVTAFLYGMSVGLSFSLSQDAKTASSVLTPVALGAVAYTLGAVGFLQLANPDRGDLPLALGITSYVPTTALLAITAADTHASGTTTGTATTVAGLLSIPFAVLAARNFDLDPGDTQLVRDAGFWGLALATLGTMGFAGHRSEEYWYSHYEAPSSRKVAVAGLLGLYGGLGLGLAAANASEVSLERVRVTTWGGYGGAVVGLLLGAGVNDGRDEDMFRGAAIGALAGLVITFVSTGSLDGIPDEGPRRAAWHRRLAPTMVQLATPTGRPLTGFGLGGAL
jgi:hypothetical protein